MVPLWVKTAVLVAFAVYFEALILMLKAKRYDGMTINLATYLKENCPADNKYLTVIPLPSPLPGR